MAQGYDADRESEQARRRLTEIAQELGRRSNPAYVKHEAEALYEEKKDVWKAQLLEKKDEVTAQVKAQLFEKKDEVKAQVKAQLQETRDELKEKSRDWVYQAKETAVKTSKEYGERAVGSPTFLGILGGIAGALAGRALAKRRTEAVSSYDRSSDRDFAYRPDRVDFRTRDFSRTEAGMRWRDDGGAPYRTQGYPDMAPNAGTDAGIGMTQADAYGTSDFNGYDSAASIDSNVGVDANADFNADTGKPLEERLGGARDAISSKAAGAKEALSSKAAGAKDAISSKAAGAKGAISSKAAGAKDAIAHRASHVAETARHRLDDAKDRMHHAYDRLPSRDAMKSEISETYHRGLEEQPWGLVAGAVGIGLVCGIFLPMSDRERQLVAPLRSKAEERLRTYRAQAEHRLQDYREQAEHFVHSKLDANPNEQANATASNVGAPTAWTNERGTTEDLSTDVQPTDLTLTGEGLGNGSLNERGTDAEVGRDVAEDHERDDRGAIAGTYEPPTVH